MTMKLKTSSKLPRLLSLFAAAAIFTSSASEAYASTCNSRGCKGKVELLFISSGGNVNVRLDSPGSPGNCNLVSDVYIVLEEGTGNFDAMFRTLLAAEMSGREIFLRTTATASGTCKVSYVTFGGN